MVKRGEYQLCSLHTFKLHSGIKKIYKEHHETTEFRRIVDVGYEEIEKFRMRETSREAGTGDKNILTETKKQRTISYEPE